jgi:hypothetical protein
VPEELPLATEFALTVVVADRASVVAMGRGLPADGLPSNELSADGLPVDSCAWSCVKRRVIATRRCSSLALCVRPAIPMSEARDGVGLPASARGAGEGVLSQSRSSCCFHSVASTRCAATVCVAR